MKTAIKYLIVLFIIEEATTSRLIHFFSPPANQEFPVEAQKVNQPQRRITKRYKSNLKKQFTLAKAKKRFLKGDRTIAAAAEKVANQMNYSERCKSDFISADGLGSLGQFIDRELSKKRYGNLFSNERAFKQFCPGFGSMSKQDKKNLWVFLVMSMSHYESSCRSNAEAQGPNGIAKGLLQLHSGSENKYSHWDQNKICRRGDAHDPIESIQCTLSMLDGQIERHDALFFEGSYWDVLRKSRNPDTHASKIRKALKMLPGCGIKSFASDHHDISQSNGDLASI
ncbi:MAG: hypothetical protein RJB66_967 [Pseudomonadota bacterium]|jgi:hypothetical protein